MALHRLQCVERKMDKNPNFAQRYIEKINDYLAKGYIRKLSRDEVEKVSPRIWYLPHFGVINPNKPEKLRLVFDAAAKSHGVSLNDYLIQGPDLLNPLVGVLLKFRQRKVAFSADIKEMFHQVRIRDVDQSSQRFLWRGMDRNMPPEVYEMQVMTFGASSSPCTAQFIKNLNATEQECSSEIKNAITKKHYVDDYLDCTDTHEEAVDRIKEVIRVQRKAGFEVVNWITNSQEVIQELSLQQGLIKNLNLDSDTPVERILGLWWNADKDEFGFKLAFHRVPAEIRNGSKRPTKREVLRLVMSVFDPLGFLAQFTVQARILIQEIWRTNIGWDDEITDEIDQQWQQWLVELQRITEVKIPRCYSRNIPYALSIELHVFCDASEKAFASVAYLRICTLDEIETAFVTAKTRVAPLKPLSIPKLELQAALMGSRMAEMIRKELEFKISDTFYWSDSRTALCWIKGDGRKYKQFVAHRIGEIQELTNIDNWNHVPTKLNAADAATRVNKSSDARCNKFLEDQKNWLQGPEFLKWPRSAWPKDTTTDPNADDVDEVDLLERKVNFVATIVNTPTENAYPDVNDFQSIYPLLRRTAWLLRFIEYLKGKVRKSNDVQKGNLKPQEIANARMVWIKKVQLEAFNQDINSLTKSHTVASSSRLKKLSPIIDEKGFLRMKGRIDNATVSEDVKRPLILDPKHRFTQLMLKSYHEKYGHQGVETVLNAVRQHYWVLNARAAVKRVFHECQRCRNARAKPSIPEMGQVPQVRLTPNVRPFEFTGVDYFGPMFVTVGRRKEKRWGVLFTCLTIRAIHLELAHSLTTDSAIMAIRRMIARRGNPQIMYSDNGTNFKGASEELRSAIVELNQSRLENEGLKHGFEWRFIPPASPHMGGCWERLVGSVKSVLGFILREEAPKDEVLLTLLAEAENIINSRPLTHVSVDPADPESLTPNHLLRCSPEGASNPGVFCDADLSLRREWRKAQRYADIFWSRWVREYLPTLARRDKWHTDIVEPLEIDDVVIIADGNMPRNQWPRGRITRIFPGSDGKIRVADVQVGNQTYRRPAAKLCKLNLKRE